MHSQKLKALLLAVLFVTPLVSRAIVIEQTTQEVGIQIEYFEPVGQSFTAASDMLTAFDFYIFPINGFSTPGPVTLRILDGAGTGGTVLATSALSLTNGYVGWAGSSFALSLVSGQQYTATLDTTGFYWGVGGAQGNYYAGGQAHLGGGYDPGVSDLMFRATFADNVPESASSLLLCVLGLITLGLLHRRTRA